MVLTLEVIGEQAEDLGAAARKVFHAIGGTIGRLPDNDWVFPDPYVSGRHALIRYLNGKYFIEDTSTNGVFINSPDKRLSRTQPQQLRDGDVLYLDAYQIRVSIVNDPASPRRNDPFANLKPGAAKAQPPRNRPVAAPEEDRTASLVMHAPEDHGTEWFGTSEMAEQPRPRARPEPMRPAAPAQEASPHRSPPAAVRPVAPAPQVRGRPSASNENSSHLGTLLTAAGIEGLDAASHDTAQTLGDVLRIAVGGVMEVLRARERMKDELRMRGTSFKAAHNNPLKFSANVDDAFHNLLVKHNPAYLEPADAFEDAFRDIRDHQAATLTAMRLAFEAMLAQFDPDRLQEEFDRQMKKGSILGAPAKMRYWDLYRDKYGASTKDAEASFRHLFSDAFAKAYEEELERLRAQGPRK
ncbi:MAG: type VI secretion system-associated FHA domain protein TagH [Steroidobacter sp.]